MSQKTDSMIKLALVFFVTLLSFSIGTYVGKKYSDNQHKLSLLEPKKETLPVALKSDEFASEAELANNTHEIMENEVPSEDQKPAALTDSEVAKIAEEFATDDDVTEDKLVATIDPQEKDLKTISDRPVLKPIAKPVVPTKKTLTEQIKKIAEEREPASIPPKKEITPLLYTVQIGSYSTQAEAEKITLDLQGKGFKTSFVPATVNGKTWFRVNVGLFGTIREAQDYKKEFLVKTKLASAIVQRVQR